MNDKLKRLIATAIASLGLFAFAACNTSEDETDTNTDTANSGSIDNGTTDNENKDDDTTGGDKKDPVIPTVPAGAVKITKAAGDQETAYAIWDKVDGATGYNVYCKMDGGDFVKLDAPLVREYKDYCRADAVGLKAGKYTFKVVPTGGADNAEDTEKAATATDITVLAHERSGYAFVNGNVPGAYNMDGTLKAGAQVVYVTAANAKTVTATVNGAEVTGFQSILDARKQSSEPLCFRIVGTVNREDLDHISSSAEGLQIKGMNTVSTGKATSNITIEGIGSDGTVNGFGFLIRNCKNVELKNLGLVNFMDDGVSLDTGNSNIWVHNLDIFYGNAGGDSDQAKGDGSLDSKGTDYSTYSYNHFWDSGKCNLLGNGSSESSGEGGATHLTYHHNWYDHSDSRHPRIRIATVHVYNNYFDGNSKYGVGVTMGASAFVENNYYRSTAKMKPMMSSLQGTDIAHGKDGQTFSGEAGGMIKAYGNVYDGKYELLTQKNTDPDNIDCYEAATRDETVPSTYKTKSGSTTYNNFDTASDFYSYEVDTAEDAKAKVEAYAGRVGGGDLKWDFDDATEDSNYSIIPGLKSAVTNYKPTVVKIGNTVVGSGSASGGNEGDDDNTGGGDNTGTTVPEGVSKVEFIAANAGKYPAGITVSGNYKDSKGNLKMESATTVTVKVEKDTVITVKTTGSSGQGIKLNGTKTSLNSSGECQITVKAGETLTITKGDTMELVYILLN